MVIVTVPTAKFAAEQVSVVPVALMVQLAGRTGTEPATVIVRVACPVPPALVADRLTGNVPATVGAPEMMPVAPSNKSPAGNPEAPKLVGEFVAAI